MPPVFVLRQAPGTQSIFFGAGNHVTAFFGDWCQARDWRPARNQSVLELGILPPVFFGDWRQAQDWRLARNLSFLELEMLPQFCLQLGPGPGPVFVGTEIMPPVFRRTRRNALLVRGASGVGNLDDDQRKHACTHTHTHATRTCTQARTYAHTRHAKNTHSPKDEAKRATRWGGQRGSAI